MMAPMTSQNSVDGKRLDMDGFPIERRLGALEKGSFLGRHEDDRRTTEPTRSSEACPDHAPLHPIRLRPLIGQTQSVDFVNLD